MKSGFIALTGRPNVGKSTLINKLTMEKVAIVSSKPQTTRDRIKGILTKGDVQYIFIDTPGIHKPLNLLGEYMTNAAISTLKDVDVILMILDGTEEIGTGDGFVFDRIDESGRCPKIAVVNKIDKMSDEDIEKKKIEIEEKPGIHKPLNLLGEYMTNAAISTLKDVDVIHLIS